MCGRYSTFASEESDEMYKLIQELIRKYPEEDFSIGEVFPTNKAPVWTKRTSKVEPELLKWGFPLHNKSSVIFNARAESVSEKPMFRESFEVRRCVVPSSGFYEWNKEKTKHHFTMKDDKILLMAGIYCVFEDETRFLIVTTNANESMQEIHHRMPLVLTRESARSWLSDKNKANEILKETPPELYKTAV